MTNSSLCEEIADIIKDYRSDELGETHSEHVQKWINQFPSEARKPILEEMTHVLSKSYISKNRFIAFLELVACSKTLAGESPKSWWTNAHLLNIQLEGSSQNDILTLFAQILKEKLGLSLTDCKGNENYVYIDDILFSGNRVKNDLSHWIKNSAPDNCKVYIVTMCNYTNGKYYAQRQLNSIIHESGKKIELVFLTQTTLEDRKYYIHSSDVLRPTSLPHDQHVQEYSTYLHNLGHPPLLRNDHLVEQSQVFSSPTGRKALEQNFLITGAEIVATICPDLPETIRPLGNSEPKMLGFGSTIITYRNCPNTCPPALWAGSPWIPLVPRKTN